MVSKRNFFSITIMMFVLLFLFQFSMVIRDRQNTYDVNSNFTTRQKDGKNVWKNKQIDPVAVRTTDRSYGMNYSYSDDIRMRSIQSSLAYTNVMLNMHDIFWPQQKTDRWQIMQKHFSSNILTYWKKFTGFDSMTLSESNTRIRTFLNLDFSESRTENEITLETSEKGSWFLLRTHGEEIAEIEGGTEKEIEDGKMEQYFQKRIENKLIFFDTVSVETAVVKDEFEVTAGAKKRKMRVSVKRSAALTVPEEKIRRKKVLQEIVERNQEE